MRPKIENFSEVLGLGSESANVLFLSAYDVGKVDFDTRVVHRVHPRKSLPFRDNGPITNDFDVVAYGVELGTRLILAIVLLLGVVES